MRPDTQRRYPFHVWRRRVAYSESLALRLLVRHHGYIPTITPTRWDT